MSVWTSKKALGAEPIRPRIALWAVLGLALGLGFGFLLASAAFAVGPQADARAVAGDPAVTTLYFERLNRSYSGVVDQMVPISQNGVGVKLRAPNHRLTIRGHEVAFSPKGDGLHAVTVEVEFLGLAHIIADLEVAGMSTALEDDVTIPLQTKTVDALVRFESAPEGYFITLADIPRSVSVAIESELGGSLVSWCDGVLGLLGFECGPLESLFSRAVVPMPENGSVFLLERAELTGEEQTLLDAYLAGG